MPLTLHALQEGVFVQVILLVLVLEVRPIDLLIERVDAE